MVEEMLMIEEMLNAYESYKKTREIFFKEGDEENMAKILAFLIKKQWSKIITFDQLKMMVSVMAQLANQNNDLLYKAEKICNDEYLYN